MSFPRRYRRHVAVLAAYVVALQALLTAFAMPAVAAGGPIFVICSQHGSDSGNPAAPAHHETCIACLAGHCAAGWTYAPLASLVEPTAIATALAPILPQTPPPPPASRERPNGPRAPPAA
jgi:hypothetical protein